MKWTNSSRWQISGRSQGLVWIYSSDDLEDVLPWLKDRSVGCVNRNVHISFIYELSWKLWGLVYGVFKVGCNFVKSPTFPFNTEDFGGRQIKYSLSQIGTEHYQCAPQESIRSQTCKFFIKFLAKPTKWLIKPCYNFGNNNCCTKINLRKSWFFFQTSTETKKYHGSSENLWGV